MFGTSTAAVNASFAFFLFVVTTLSALASYGLVMVGQQYKLLREAECNNRLLVWLAIESVSIVNFLYETCIVMISKNRTRASTRRSSSKGMCGSFASPISPLGFVAGIVLVYFINHDECEHEIVDICKIFIIAYVSLAGFYLVMGCVLARFISTSK